MVEWDIGHNRFGAHGGVHVGKVGINYGYPGYTYSYPKYKEKKSKRSCTILWAKATTNERMQHFWDHIKLSLRYRASLIQFIRSS